MRKRGARLPFGDHLGAACVMRPGIPRTYSGSLALSSRSENLLVECMSANVLPISNAPPSIVPTLSGTIPEGGLTVRRLGEPHRKSATAEGYPSRSSAIREVPSI